MEVKQVKNTSSIAKALSTKKRVVKRQWIQKVDMKKGALRETVQRRYGEKGFLKKDGKIIRPELLRKLAGEKGVTGRRARLAITLKGLKKR